MCYYQKILKEDHYIVKKYRGKRVKIQKID